MPDIPTEAPLPGETILLMENLQMTPVDTKQIKTCTDRDPVLSQVRQILLQGWPSGVKKNLFLMREGNMNSVYKTVASCGDVG